MLKKFNSITNNQALIIAETLDPFQTKEPHHLQYQKLNRKRGRLGGEARIRVRYQTYITPWFKYWLASKSEMKQLLHGTSWQVKRFFNSKRPVYIAIIEKE